MEFRLTKEFTNENIFSQFFPSRICAKCRCLVHELKSSNESCNDWKEKSNV